MNKEHLSIYMTYIWFLLFMTALKDYFFAIF